jgi:formamidopyrimidine-DNA glycosylase
VTRGDWFGIAERVPELPDVVVYIEALEERILGVTLDRVRLASPFLLRTTTPSLGTVEGKKVERLRRVGKRIAIGFEGEIWIVLHLMIAGRLHWKAPAVKLPAKRALAAFDFGSGSLLLTEAGSQKRASLHMAAGEDGLDALDPGGLEIFGADWKAFSAALTSESHTLKRALTDPRIFSGIGNAYSDEILHRAGLSPVTLTRRLADDEIRRLFDATIQTLNEWVARLRAEAGGRFPEHVTAFRDEMAVHGKYGQPCPRCGSKVQRIRYAANETNYCPKCQTGGKLLADRGLSRLLREDWPRTPEELESLLRRA